MIKNILSNYQTKRIQKTEKSTAKDYPVSYIYTNLIRKDQIFYGYIKSVTRRKIN